MAAKIPEYKINGAEGKLVSKGAELDKEIKRLTTELSDIKEKMTTWKTGKYITSSGSSVTISETDKYSEIDPAAAKQALRDKRLGQFFLKCIKIQVTELGKLLSDVELNSLREKVGKVRKCSFK